MKIKEKAKSLIRVLSARGVGHTTLLISGLKNYTERPFGLICLNMNHGKQITEGLQNATITTLVNAHTVLTGKSMPVAVDHAVLVNLLTDCVQLIEKLEDSNSVKGDVIQSLMKIAEHYQNRAHEIELISMDMIRCPWWNVAKLIRLEKRMHLMIMSYNTDPAISAEFNKLIEKVKGKVTIKN